MIASVARDEPFLDASVFLPFAIMQPSRREEFEIALICALPLEYNAVSLLFDEFWDEDGDHFGRAAGDPNNYTTGRIGKYNVVLALLPHTGKVNAASTAASVRSSYTGLTAAERHYSRRIYFKRV